MTWIKICGTTNLEDALTAVDAGADALGFVLYEKSPRYVVPKTVREIVRQLPSNVETVGVFVDETAEAMEALAEEAGLAGVQLHVTAPRNDRGTMFPNSSKLKRYLALPARLFVSTGEGRMWFLPDEGRESISALLLDSGTTEVPGGTGKAFDWQSTAPLVEPMKLAVRIVIAGGLNSGNVAEAMRILTPWGVDVVSGVESSPGRKDPAKVRAFIAAVRAVEKSS